jgi:hypothetical protein
MITQAGEVVAGVKAGVHHKVLVMMVVEVTNAT